jgi:DNA-binding transcriptional LysR family regulator
MTWAGQVFLKQAYKVITAIEQIRASVVAAAIGRQGQIRIGLSDSIAYSRAAALLSEFKFVANNLDVRFFELPPALQIEWVREDLLDVGFVPGPVPSEGIVAEPVWEEAVLVALPKRHRLALMETVSLSELAGEPLLLFESGAGSHINFGGLNRDFFERSPIAGKVNSVSVLLALIAAGHGIGFATAQQMSSASAQGIVLRPLKEADLTLTTYLIRPDGLPSEAAARFLDWTRQTASVQKLPLPPAEIPDPAT